MCLQPPAKPQILLILFCLFKKKSTKLCYKRGLGPEEVKKIRQEGDFFFSFQF